MRREGEVTPKQDVSMQRKGNGSWEAVGRPPCPAGSAATLPWTGASRHAAAGRSGKEGRECLLSLGLCVASFHFHNSPERQRCKCHFPFAFEEIDLRLP